MENEFEQRKQVFVGKVKKCPQCGQILTSDAVVCSECGFELGVNSISQELIDFKNNIGKLETHALSNEKVAILLKSTISNFSVPHTKGDLRDLLVFVGGKVRNETTDAEWFRIWYAKHKQIVDEVCFLFPNDKEFTDPFVQQQQACDTIAENRRLADTKALKKKNRQKHPMSPALKKTIIGLSIFIVLFICSLISQCVDDSKKSVKKSAKVTTELSEAIKEQASAKTADDSKASSNSYEKKTFKSVKIGNQVWAAENLAIKTDESVCYENSDEKCKTYGRLYTWKAARNACPDGWSLPTIEDIRTLTSYMQEKGVNQAEMGTALKSAKGWNKNKGTPAGTDKFKFKGLPGGRCGYYLSSSGAGGCEGAGDVAYFWTATKDNDLFSVDVRIDYDKSEFNGERSMNSEYLSVRCLKD